MRVFVLGHQGMWAMCRPLSGTARLPGAHFGLAVCRPGPGSLVETARDSGCDWIVNCIGRTKQKSDNPVELFFDQFPVTPSLGTPLASQSMPGPASTDCVFSGRQGHYPVNGEQDAETYMAFPRPLASCRPSHRCVVIRTSIIGPELGGGHGLLGWF